MHQLRRRTRSPQRTLPFREANQMNLWSILTSQQQQSCRRLLSQLLEEVLSEDRKEPQMEGSDADER